MGNRPGLSIGDVWGLQLSSCMVHVWTSIGKFFRSMGQERMSVNLEHDTDVTNTEYIREHEHYISLFGVSVSPNRRL